MTTPNEGDQSRIELTPDDIRQIVDILVKEYPLGSEQSHAIAGPYRDSRCATDTGIGFITEAVAEQLGLDYATISNHEHEIIPAYMKAIYYRPDATAFAVYRSQTATERKFRLVEHFPVDSVNAAGEVFKEAEEAVGVASDVGELVGIMGTFRSRLAEALPGDQHNLLREAMTLHFERVACDWLKGPNEETLRKIENTLEFRFGARFGANLKRNACALGMLLGMLKFQLEGYFNSSGVLITLSPEEFNRLRRKMTELKEANERAAEEQGIDLG